MPMPWSGSVDGVQYPVQEGVDPGVDARYALGAAEPGPEADHADEVGLVEGRGRGLGRDLVTVTRPAPASSPAPAS